MLKSENDNGSDFISLIDQLISRIDNFVNNPNADKK